MQEKKRLLIWPTFVLVLGLLFVAFALIWPWLGRAEQIWTEEKAIQLQQAASTLHKLDGHGSELGGQRPGSISTEPSEKARQYDEARREFQYLKLELQAAKTGSQRTRKWLLGCGISLLTVGAIGRNIRRRSVSS